METAHFEQLVPRLTSVQAEVLSIRRDLAAAIEDAKASPAQPVQPENATFAEALQQQPPIDSSRGPTAPREVEPELPPATSTDWESLLAGRWLHLTGLLLVFLGTAFFLKVAFDHNWIVPSIRVSMGLVAGAALIAYAQRLASKGQTYFSEGVTALGAAIEFLSLYSSYALFHLASPTLVLVGMIGVNAAMAAIAWRRRSERLGILAALGAFFAPVLTGTSGDPWMLAGYITMLNVGLLVLGELVESRVIAPLALTGTLLYAAASFSGTSGLNDVQRAIVYGILYASFAGSGWVVTKLRGKLDVTRSIVGGVAIGALLIGLESTLTPAHRPLLAGALLALTAFHLLSAIACKSRYQSWLAALALTFAIPAAFDQGMVSVAWAFEAAILALAGTRYNDIVLRAAGLILLGSDILRDIIVYAVYTPQHVFLNERFASGAAAFGATFVIALDLDRNGTSSVDATIARALRITTHALALVTLCAEVWSGVQLYGGPAQGSSAALSVVGAAFAGVLIAAGFYKRDSLLRWEGLGLIVLTAAKVLIVDLSFLDISYRVISAVLVGIALIAVSYAYQRRAAANGALQ